MKKLLKLALASTLALSILTACASEDSSSGSASKEFSDFKIGIVQYMEHDALDFSREGFVQELLDYGFDESSIEIQNAQGEPSNCATIANKFVNDKVDLILAIATPAAQSASQATSDIPVLATAITSFETAGLTADNVTGTSNMNPPLSQLDLITTIVPDVSTVGFLYCSNELNSIYQVETLIPLLEANGIKTQEFTVADSNEVQQVTQNALTQDIDLIYVPNDNILAQTISTVGLLAGETGMPVICGESSVAANGGLVANALDYTKLGAQTARQAIDILVNNVDISTIEVEYMPEDEIEIYINQEMFDKIGMEVPDALK